MQITTIVPTSTIGFNSGQCEHGEENVAVQFPWHGPELLIDHASMRVAVEHARKCKLHVPDDIQEIGYKAPGE